MENEEVAEVAENDLVMLRLNNDPSIKGRQRHYNTWLRVRFIDLDGSFIGEVERVNQWEFTLHAKGDHVKYPLENILRVYKEGKQWCYFDNITICECPGLCRNKM